MSKHRFRPAPRRASWALACLLAPLAAGCGRSEPASGAPTTSSEPSAFAFPGGRAQVKHDIPLKEIRRGIHGRDPRDAIEALVRPVFVRPEEATFLLDSDRVLAFGEGDEARAYPLFLLDGHEVVNDVVDGVPVVVTWCPLCGAGAVFERRVEGVVRTFGVSGYLWRTDLLMYDRESETFWSQIAARGVVGPLTGSPLTLLRSDLVTWGTFRRRHPQGRVLVTGRGEGKDPAAYRQDRYAAYRAHPDLFGGLEFRDERLGNKDEVVGVVLDGQAYAWSLEHVRKASAEAGGSPGDVFHVLVEPAGTSRVRLRYGAEGDWVDVLDADGSLRIPYLRCYWFAWVLFHPDTTLDGH